MRDTFNYTFSRILRTLSSEIYIAYENKDRIAEIHLHYVGASVYCSFLIEHEDCEINSLLEALEADVVSSCIPEYEREDFSVTVFRANEISSFSYIEETFDENQDEEDFKY